MNDERLINFMTQLQEQQRAFMEQQQAALLNALHAALKAPEKPATIVVTRDEHGRMVGTIQ